MAGSFPQKGFRGASARQRSARRVRLVSFPIWLIHSYVICGKSTGLIASTCTLTNLRELLAVVLSNKKNVSAYFT